MKKKLFNLWSNYKNKQGHKHDQEEIRAFNITEKDGVIYIIAGMRAIKAIDENTTAKEIVELLEECRRAQLNFKK